MHPGALDTAVSVGTEAKRFWAAESQHFENQPQMASQLYVRVPREREKNL